MCETGSPIVYTSADSVFQIAAHEDVVPIPQLYEWCEIAYELAVEGLGLGRVIARPFVGPVGAFKRTANRHDYAMPPRGETLLDKLTAAGDPGDGHRQDQGSLRRARASARRFRPRVTLTGWTASKSR